MAGDWIPMRLDLYEDPSVIQMATALGEREEVVVGYLHKVWSWASRQLRDGCATGVSVSTLGRATNLPGFPEVMRDAGWLSEDSDGISFPNWDHWLSESAKKRLQNTQRQRQKRKSDEEEVPEKSVALLSRKKSDKIGTSVLSCKSLLKDLRKTVSEKMADSVESWIEYKSERNERYKPRGLQAFFTQINKAENQHGAPAVVQSIESAMANGWKGWQHGLENSNGAPKKPARVTYIPPEERQ